MPSDTKDKQFYTIINLEERNIVKRANEKPDSDNKPTTKYLLFITYVRWDQFEKFFSGAKQFLKRYKI